jgi:hypothetical protein
MKLVLRFPVKDITEKFEAELAHYETIRNVLDEYSQIEQYRIG